MLALHTYSVSWGITCSEYHLTQLIETVPTDCAVRSIDIRAAYNMLHPSHMDASQDLDCTDRHRAYLSTHGTTFLGGPRCHMRCHRP